MMKGIFSICPFVVLFLFWAPFSVQAQEIFDAAVTKDAILERERAWLDYEIGRFAAGREAVFSGNVTITQTDRDEVIELDGRAFATLSPGPTATLSIILPESGRWVRLSQNAAAPEVTYVTRLRPQGANDGVTALCTDCMPTLADLPDAPMFLRVTAEGTLVDAERSRFRVDLSGSFERIAPETLNLSDILLLRPDITAAHRRPDSTFGSHDNRAAREVSEVLRHRAPPPADRAGLSCYYVTPYTALHVVDRGALSDLQVENVTLGDTFRCCIDNVAHDPTRVCTEESGK